MRMGFRIFVFLLFLAFGLSTQAQSLEEYELRYKNAKAAYESAQFKEAVVWFDALCIAANDNPYFPYANYFKAYSYIKIGQYADARFVLVKLQEEVPDWPKQDEVKYLLAYSQCLDKQFVEAQTTIKSIKGEDLKTKGQNMFYHFFAVEKDLELIKNVQYKLKKDNDLAFILAQRLSTSKDSSNILMLKYLVQDYKLIPEEFGMKVGKKKDVYTVALMLPFSLSNPRAYLNTPSLNIKDGVLFALDSLKEKGINIDLKLFDTDRNLTKVVEILNSEGFKNVDLILGPVSGPACVAVAKYANEHKILNFNFSREKAPSSLGTYVYSTRPSFENTGRQLAKAAKESFDTTKSVRIYYGKSRDGSDSVIAANYKKEIEKLGLKVVAYKFVKEDMAEFRNSLNAMRDSETSHVAVFATENSLMASTLISVWEGGNKEIPVIAPKEWLEIHLINYDQFYRKNIHFIYNDYIIASEELKHNINKKHLDLYGVKPMSLTYLAMGFDAMMYCGEHLFQNGTQFQKQIRTQGFQELPLTAGIDLSNSDSNAIVPLLKFDEEFNFIWVNEPK